MIWTNAYFYDTIKKEYISETPLSVNFGTNINDNEIELIYSEEMSTDGLVQDKFSNTFVGNKYPKWYWGEYDFRNIIYSLYQQNYMDYLGTMTLGELSTGFTYYKNLPIELHNQIIPDYKTNIDDIWHDNFIRIKLKLEAYSRSYPTREKTQLIAFMRITGSVADKETYEEIITVFDYYNDGGTGKKNSYGDLLKSYQDIFTLMGFFHPKLAIVNQKSEINQLLPDSLFACEITPLSIDDTFIPDIDTGKPQNKAIKRMWTSKSFAEYWNLLIKVLNNTPADNIPEFPGNTQEPERPNGSYEDFNDKIDYPPLPSITASTSGFVTLYSPTLEQIKNFAGYMWNGMANAGDLFNALNKMVANPIDMVLGLSILPFPIETIGDREIKIGLIGTGITMNLASSQYKVIDCGELQLLPYYGSALDYSPYTKISIYLPYIGVRALNVDEIQGKKLSLRYHIDIMTGALSAMIKVNDSVLYTFGGMCAQMIPITANNWATMLGTIATLVAVPLTAGIAGGIAGAMGASSGAAAATASKNAATVASVSSSTAGILGQAGALASSIAKPSVQRSGSVTSSSAFMDVQTPYILIERPRQSLPKDYNKFVGYPANYSAELATLTGFTRVDSIKLVINGATQNELQEIKNLLETGVTI